MKLGLTQAEKDAVRMEREDRRMIPTKVFAWVPRFCRNTGRYVWLEYVTVQYDYYLHHPGYNKHYKEIE